MFDLGWTELLLIGIVALIVVGPKDLPGMFRTVGNFVGKAKRMARDFSKAMNDAADEAGVSDVKRSFDAASNPMKSAMNEVRKSTESFTARSMAGPEREIDPERAEQAEKIRQRAGQMAEERKAKEAEAARAEPPDAADDAGADKAPPAAKKAATKKTATTAKKTTAKKTTAKSASGAAKSTSARKPAAGKTAAKTTPKKPAARKSTARKPAEDKA